ncbi:TetR/AcrR family transcriptional regulator, partial [Rhizobiaceae sp. 2RAB30]
MTSASPAKRRPNRAEKAEATRNALFEAAIEVVGEYGYAGTSIARITERAGVAQGTFYNYFESRQDLLDQLLPAISQRLHIHIRERVLAADSAVERERARISAFFEFLERAPHLFKIL